MKKIGIALASLFLGISSANSADLAVKARPAPAPVLSWTGFYAGLNAGYGWGDSSSTLVPVDPVSQFFFSSNGGLVPANELNSSFRQQGAIAGGQAGYNWQFGTAGVMGIEGDLQWADIRGAGYARSLNGQFDANSERRLQWFGTVRARLGLLASPNLLLYATGGLAYGQTDTRGDIGLTPPAGNQIVYLVQIPPLLLVCTNGTAPRGVCYSGSNSETQIGWTAGVGGEWKVTPNWSLKLEYLHVGLPGNSTTMVAVIPPSTPNVTTVYRYNNQDYDIVRFGVNYQFGSGAVVAKY